MADDTGFLSRWSRRKVQVARGDDVGVAPGAPGAPPPSQPARPPAPQPMPAVPTAATSAAQPGPDQHPPPAADPLRGAYTTDAPSAPPAPTLDEARALTPEADFRRFVARDVDPAVRNTALKALFRDPHFNVMDGLDIYIDDYSIPDPLPAGMLRRMTQSVALGLFRDDPTDQTMQADAGGPGTTDAAPEGRPEQTAESTAEPPEGATSDAAAGDDSEPPPDTDTDADLEADARQDAPSRPSGQAASDPAPAPVPTPPHQTPPATAHEDTDLRLQPHDAAGHAGDREGAASQSGRQR